MTKPLDWTAAIELQATAWQGAIPAKVVSGPDIDGDYLVQMLAEHRLYDGGNIYPAGSRWWVSGSGRYYGENPIRIVNRTEPAATDWQSAAKAAGWTPPVDPLEEDAWKVLSALHMLPDNATISARNRGLKLKQKQHAIILEALCEARDGAL